MKKNSKVSQFSSFLSRSEYVDQVEIWKWRKVPNSGPFHQETTCKSILHSNLIILTDFHSFTVNEKNSNISQKKVLNSVPFIKKTLVNQFYIRTWSFWLTFTVLQWMKTNFKISQFSRFLLRYAILVKTWKWLKLINSVLSIKETLVNHVYILTWSSWLTFTVLQWMKTNMKISKLSRFLLRSGYAILVKILKWLKFLNSVPLI